MRFRRIFAAFTPAAPSVTMTGRDLGRSVLASYLWHTQFAARLGTVAVSQPLAGRASKSSAASAAAIFSAFAAAASRARAKLSLRLALSENAICKLRGGFPKTNEATSFVFMLCWIADLRLRAKSLRLP